MKFGIALLLWMLSAIALLISMRTESLRALIVSTVVFAFASMFLIGVASLIPTTYCEVCGSSYEADYNYCPVDGTELEIVKGE